MRLLGDQRRDWQAKGPSGPGLHRVPHVGIRVQRMCMQIKYVIGFGVRLSPDVGLGVWYRWSV